MPRATNRIDPRSAWLPAPVAIAICTVAIAGTLAWSSLTTKVDVQGIEIAEFKQAVAKLSDSMERFSMMMEENFRLDGQQWIERFREVNRTKFPELVVPDMPPVRRR